MDEIEFSYICKLIFKNTSDLIILERLKRVNILWKNYIDKILETSDAWKRACLNEIPSEPIPFMITRLFPTLYFENYHELDGLTLWRTVYVSYRKWMILSKLRVLVEDSFQIPSKQSLYEKIVASASCDTYFAFGTFFGKIYIFDVNQLTKPIEQINCEECIETIRFWSPASGELFLVARICFGDIKFWNVSTMSEDKCINIDRPRSDFLCTGSTNILFTKHSNKFNEYKYTKDGIRSCYVKNFQLRGYPIACFQENSKMRYVAMPNNTVTLFNCRNQTFDGNSDIIEEDHQEIPQGSDYGISDIVFAPEPYFVFLTPNVILQRSVKGNAYLLIYNQRTNWRLYEPFQKFGDRDVVTTGILHGKLLILGFHTGHVRIYTVENIEDLKTSKLNLHSGIGYHFSNHEYSTEIKQLQVAETQGKLIIIAISSCFVHSITFFSKKSPQQIII